MNYEQKGIIKPQYVIEKIFELTKGDAIISTEVGQNQMWTAQYFPFLKPRTLLTSGGLGTMGYGFPAAMGAQAAFPNKLVIDIAGDGSFQMNSQELATVVQYQLPVKVAILNNGYLGNGETVAGILLRETICLIFSGRNLSRLCQTGRGLWSRWVEGDQTRRGRPHIKEGLLDLQACYHRFCGRSGGECLSHGPGRRTT